MAVVNANAVTKLVKLLQSNESAVAEQSVLALNKIADDSQNTRDIVLVCGAAEAILELLEKEQPVRWFIDIYSTNANIIYAKIHFSDIISP